MRTSQVALFVLICGGSALAQAPARIDPPAKSTTEQRQPADGALQISLQAHGGANLLAAQTIMLRGKSTVNKVDQPLTISASLDGSSRVEWGSPVTRIIVTTPQGRSEITNGNSVPRTEHSGIHAALDMLSVLGIRGTYGSGANRGVVGMTNLGEKEIYRIHAGTDKQQVFYGRALKDEQDIDFDPVTGLVFAIHRREYADNDLNLEFVTTFTFADYQDVAGMKLPFHIERYMDGRLRETISVDAYEINAALGRDTFAR